MYADPRNRVCEHCVNRKGVMGRLMAYFTVFKKHVFIVLLCLLATTGLSLLTPIVNRGPPLRDVLCFLNYLDNNNTVSKRFHSVSNCVKR